MESLVQQFDRKSSQKARPVGGYRKVTTRQICLAWCAYREGVLARYFDFRVYWALHEVDERQRIARRLSNHETTPCPKTKEWVAGTVREAARLLGGVSVQHVRGALGRLVRARLISIETAELSFTDALTAAPDEVRSASESMLRRIDQRQRVRERTVPIPRRILRYLVREPSPSLAATVFGHALRCLWMNGSEFRGLGICSAGLVGDLFGAHIRSVKRERARLLRVGWLQKSSGEGRAGDTRPWFQVNLGWIDPTFSEHGETIRTGPDRVCNTSVPPCIGETPIAVPVELHPRRQALLSPQSRPDLICINNPSFKTKYVTGSQVRPPTTVDHLKNGFSKNESGPPDFRRVTLCDLKSVSRLDELHAQAANAKLVSASSAGRLLMHSAAERALRVGTRNPCGLFVAIVRRGLWRHISQQDEDAALKRLATWTRQSESSLDCRANEDDRSIQRTSEEVLAMNQGRDPMEVLRKLVDRVAAGRSFDVDMRSRRAQGCVRDQQVFDVA